jgi:hypothetical protein
MPYNHAKVVLTKRSLDGRKEVELLARHDGLFEFRESILTWFEHGLGPEEVWAQGYQSGLFQTVRRRRTI